MQPNYEDYCGVVHEKFFQLIDSVQMIQKPNHVQFIKNRGFLFKTARLKWNEF